MLTRTNKSLGFTLVEMMVALLVSTVLIGSAISILSSSVKSAHENVSSIHVDQALQDILKLMANDIRRAGYWANSTADVARSSNSNPFMTTGTDLQIGANNTCILLSYDANADGSLKAIHTNGDDERYGYRLRSNAIQTRPASGQFSCEADTNNWENITDRNIIVISQLQFQSSNKSVDIDGNSPGTGAIKIRNIDITITGHATGDPSVAKTVSYRVRLRNDKYIP